MQFKRVSENLVGLAESYPLKKDHEPYVEIQELPPSSDMLSFFMYQIKHIRKLLACQSCSYFYGLIIGDILI